MNASVSVDKNICNIDNFLKSMPLVDVLLKAQYTSAMQKIALDKTNTSILDVYFMHEWDIVYFDSSLKRND